MSDQLCEPQQNKLVAAVTPPRTFGWHRGGKGGRVSVRRRERGETAGGAVGLLAPRKKGAKVIEQLAPSVRGCAVGGGVRTIISDMSWLISAWKAKVSTSSSAMVNGLGGVVVRGEEQEALVSCDAGRARERESTKAADLWIDEAADLAEVPC